MEDYCLQLEYHLVILRGADEEESRKDASARARIALIGPEVLSHLEEEDREKLYEVKSTWHPEYGSWMVEATPGFPYGNDVDDLLAVEVNMATRRARICAAAELVGRRLLGEPARVFSVVAFPLMGVGAFTEPVLRPGGVFARSIYVPDAVISPHVRFGTLTANIRTRRGARVSVVLPLGNERSGPVTVTEEEARQWAALPRARRDGVTRAERHAAEAECDAEAELEWRGDDGKDSVPTAAALNGDAVVHADAMAFGMGCCCLQVTFQARDLAESRYLYDSLAVLSPLVMALSAATPIFRGRLVATDTRWDIIADSVDDRTPSERGVPSAESGLLTSGAASTQWFPSEKVARAVAHAHDVAEARGLHPPEHANKFAARAIRRAHTAAAEASSSSPPTLQAHPTAPMEHYDDETTKKPKSFGGDATSKKQSSSSSSPTENQLLVHPTDPIDPSRLGPAPRLAAYPSLTPSDSEPSNATTEQPRQVGLPPSIEETESSQINESDHPSQTTSSPKIPPPLFARPTEPVRREPPVSTSHNAFPPDTLGDGDKTPPPIDSAPTAPVDSNHLEDTPSIRAEPTEPMHDDVPALRAKATEPMHDDVPALRAKATEPIYEHAPPLRAKATEPIHEHAPPLRAKATEPIHEQAPPLRAKATEPIHEQAPPLRAKATEPIHEQAPPLHATPTNPVPDQVPRLVAMPTAPVVEVPSLSESVTEPLDVPSSARGSFPAAFVSEGFGLASTGSRPGEMDEMAGTVSWQQLEESEHAASRGRRRLLKARYGSIDCFIADTPEHREEYNDLPVVTDEAAYERLRQGGVDHRLSRHVAHLLVRDPLVVFADAESVDDDKAADHWENFQSTNWNSVRWKPPPPGVDDIGWRVELRTIEVAPTDFENAALTVFSVLVSRVVLFFGLNLYIPMSLVDANFAAARDHGAASRGLYYFRRKLIPLSAVCGPDGLPADLIAEMEAEEARLSEDRAAGGGGGGERDVLREDAPWTLMTMEEILMGRDEDEDFPGLIPLIYAYLEKIGIDDEHHERIDAYLRLLVGRARGEIQTPAEWMRQYLEEHPLVDDSGVVPPSAAADLLQEIDDVAKGVKLAPSLVGPYGVAAVAKEASAVREASRIVADAKRRDQAADQRLKAEERTDSSSSSSSSSATTTKRTTPLRGASFQAEVASRQECAIIRALVNKHHVGKKTFAETPSFLGSILKK